MQFSFVSSNRRSIGIDFPSRISVSQTATPETRFPDRSTRWSVIDLSQPVSLGGSWITVSAGNAPSNSTVPEIFPGDTTDISRYGWVGTDTTDDRGATLPSFGFFGCAADAGFSSLHP